jgi:hypothetical protein
MPADAWPPKPHILAPWPTSGSPFSRNACPRPLRRRLGVVIAMHGAMICALPLKRKPSLRCSQTSAAKFSEPAQRLRSRTADPSAHRRASSPSCASAVGSTSAAAACSPTCPAASTVLRIADYDDAQAMVVGLVPTNETAVACGNEAISVEARGGHG